MSFIKNNIKLLAGKITNKYIYKILTNIEYYIENYSIYKKTKP